MKFASGGGNQHEELAKGYAVPRNYGIVKKYSKVLPCLMDFLRTYSETQQANNGNLLKRLQPA